MIKLKRISDKDNKKHDDIKLIQKPGYYHQHHVKTKKESFFSDKKNLLLLLFLSMFWSMIIYTVLYSLPIKNHVVIPQLDDNGNRLLALKKKLVKEHRPSNRKRMTGEELQYIFGRDKYGIIPPEKKKSNNGTSTDKKQEAPKLNEKTQEWIEKTLVEASLLRPTNVNKNIKTEKVKNDDDYKTRTYCKCVDCDTDKLCGGLWRGNLVLPPPPKVLNKTTISIVLSHCNKSLDWVNEFVGKIPIANFTIISKCNEEVKNAPKNSTILRLPNVGRCDHSYLYYIARFKKGLTDKNKRHIHIFLKDSRFIHQDGDLRSLKEMIDIAYMNGFACGLTCPYQMSVFHKTSVLRRFAIDTHRNTPDKKRFKSNYKNMGAWIDALNIASHVPDPFTPVCYSGIFAVRTDHIVQYERSFWDALEKSLSRGNSIEEGHFMERLWSTLFSNRLKDYEVQGIQDYMETYNGACCYNGALMHDIYDDI